MKISILTPTENRESFLKRLYRAIRKQKTSHAYEWLILDTSPSSSDFFAGPGQNCRYIHSSEPLTLGEKRNWLIEEARGDLLIHFDDDDYYSPHYLERVVEQLERSDFFTLSRWFSYFLETEELFYWSADEIRREHYRLSGYTKEVCDLEKGVEDKAGFIESNLYGYGFSYAYRRDLAKSTRFDPLNFAEDIAFFQKVRASGAKIGCLPDEEGLALHLLHGQNSSTSYPQYLLPAFLTQKLFPEFELSL